MRITCQADIERGVAHLADRDERLRRLAGICGPVPLRLSEPDFAGLASIIVSQQVSKASADAIFGRLTSLVTPLTPENFLAAGETAWKAAGLSGPKQRTLTAISEAVLAGDLPLSQLCGMAPDSAIEQMVAVKGIGPWTAEVYLMFCAGHQDIFPAGDLALQEAIRLGFDLAERPNEKTCRAIADAWTPWRAVAARLLWRYYGVVRREAAPV